MNNFRFKQARLALSCAVALGLAAPALAEAQVSGRIIDSRQQLLAGQAPSLETQAQLLHQSPRTLRRRLEEQSLSFRQLLDQVRAELEQYLELQGNSRTQIAAQLGYSDLAAYLHARKRWRG